METSLDIAQLMQQCTSTDDKLAVARLGRGLHLLSLISRDKVRKADSQVIILTEELDELVQTISNVDVKKTLIDALSRPKAGLNVWLPGRGSIVDTTI